MSQRRMMNTTQAEKIFKAGEVIMTQGETGSCAYYIQEGKVAIVVEKSDGQLLEMGTRSAGSIIGEMAIVDDQPRSATVQAVEDCKLLEISREDFSRSVKSADPIVRLISQVILMRYRDILRRSDTLADDMGIDSPEILEQEYARQSNVVEAIKIASEFKVALASNQLFLNYQPIMNLVSGRIAGFEALLRWRHPERGLIPPDTFIPMAEKSGLIIEASRWVLRESCRALKRLEAHHAGESLFMSVNFSSTDFDEEDFLEHFTTILDETETQPEKIHLEITERLLMKQPRNVQETLTLCRNRGMGVSIDDFGTGYSSLSYLHQYPINTLKIDKSFIQNMSEDKMASGLVKSILSLSENLGMDVIAEGVETEKEARLLRELNCSMAQGYYFARPLAEADAVSFLTAPVKFPAPAALT